MKWASKDSNPYCLPTNEKAAFCYFYHCSSVVAVALINIIGPNKKKKEKVVYIVCVTIYVDLISLTMPAGTRHGLEIWT